MTSTIRPARKTMREAYPSAAALRENIELLMMRYRDSRNAIAKYLDIDIATLRRRLDDPTEFKIGEIEMLALRWDVSVSQLTQPVRLVADEPILR